MKKRNLRKQSHSIDELSMVQMNCKHSVLCRVRKELTCNRISFFIVTDPGTF